MTIIQVDLIHMISPSNVAQMTTWVNKDPRLKVGSVIRLKDSPRDWTVSKIYGVEHDYSEFEWHRKWTNNI